MLHGGGVTPVAQTVDTDLNQHVRREYTALESAELISQMRRSSGVPKAKEETCIDMMAEVLSRTELHLGAADGYKKTGFTVALDGTEDHLIVREAAVFWKEMTMRPRIDKEVEHVREEVSAGRLRWTKADVERLIQPYPQKKEDAILARLKDDTWLEEGEVPYAEEADAMDGECQWSDGDSTVEALGEALDADVLGDDALGDPAGAESPSRSRGGGDRADTLAVAELSAQKADEIHASEMLLDTFDQAIVSLRAVGAMSAVANLENEMRKERRRQRALGKEDAAVAVALARKRDAADLEAQRQRRMLADANAKTLTAQKLQKELGEATALLKKRKAELQDMENIAESKHTVRRFSVESLGQGQAKGGGVAARKKRFEVLDRLARLGSGLSVGQKNDWLWFREAWDERMLEELGVDWGGTFAGWMQEVLNDFDAGKGNAFSEFVHNETRRCFDLVPALVI